MKAHILAVLGYVLATLLVQGTSHFVVFADHYAAHDWYRTEPIMPLGLASMVIQGTILTLVFVRMGGSATGIKGALICAWAFGAFLVSYMALALAGEHRVASVPAWIAIETGAGLVQFTLAGLALHFAHRRG